MSESAVNQSAVNQTAVNQTAVNRVQTLGQQIVHADQHVLIDAHAQRTTLHVVEMFPAHEPRETDPHYHYFNEARARLKALGKLTCWVGNADCRGQIELHHATCEFALANGVDVSKFAQLYPEFGVTTDEEFLAWVEGEGNLTPLCKMHHTGILGVHCMPYPVFLPQRFWKDGIAAPAHCETGNTKETGK